MRNPLVNQPKFRVIYSLFFLSFWITSCAELPLESTPPNILLIVSEDNGPDLGCYGVKEVNTPHLDKLAKEGVRFEHAFVTYSVCSPSRSTIFTGLYPHQNGQIGLATHKYSMYDSLKTLPVFLKEAGYRTGCLGKIHVNPESIIPFDFHPIKGANFAKKNLPAYAEEAETFMNASEEPFFLMVNYPDAHYPLQAQVEGMPARPLEASDLTASIPFIGTDSKRLREFTANYYNSMNRLDEAVGMLLAKLQASGKAENTMIVYLGDHGAQFSRGKCSNYEAGLKVPFIINWPGNMESSQVRQELVSSIDLLPTLLSAANIQTPSHLPGHSLLPLLQGKKVEDWRKYVFAGGTGSTALLYYPRRSVRDKRYKLIHNLLADKENPKYTFYTNHHNVHFAGGTTEEELAHAKAEIQQAYKIWQSPPTFELYDLQTDPMEFNNLVADLDYVDILERMKLALKDWQVGSEDPFGNEEILGRFTREIDSINQLYPDHAYRSAPEFSWQYLQYFSPISTNNP